MIRTGGTRAWRPWLCAAATSLLALPAAAQTDGLQAANIQAQFGDVIANQSLHVDEASAGVTGGASATGDSASATGGGADLALTSSQHLGAVYVGANATVTVDGSGGAQVSNTASATGGKGVASLSGGYLNGASTQTVDPGATVSASSFTHLGALSGTLAADAAAVGDTQAWKVTNGALNAFSVQTQGGQVAADSGASSLGGLTDDASHAARAVSNRVSVDAQGSPIELTVDQKMTGPSTRATAYGYALGADDGEANAVAKGDVVHVKGDAAADVYADQETYGAVDAQADLKLNSWNTAASKASGVGNELVLANAGPTTSLGVDQYEGAPVSAAASFTGYDGGDATATATATGNAVSVTTGGGVGGFANQTSDGAVRATSVMAPGAANSATGVASATGNSAVFQVTGSGR